MPTKFVGDSDLNICLNCGVAFVDLGGNITFTEYAQEEGRTKIYLGEIPCCGERRPEVAQVTDSNEENWPPRNMVETDQNNVYKKRDW